MLPWLASTTCGILGIEAGFPQTPLAWLHMAPGPFVPLSRRPELSRNAFSLVKLALSSTFLCIESLVLQTSGPWP